MGKSARPVDEETDDLVSHVRFETEVLAVALDRLKASELPTYPDRIDRSIQTNALLICLRNLLCFFVGSRGRGGNSVIASDYTSPANWLDDNEPAREAMARLRRTIGHISVRVAHISRKRLNDAQLPALSTIAQDLDLLLAAFDDKDKHRFHRSLDAALQHVRTANLDGSSPWRLDSYDRWLSDRWLYDLWIRLKYSVTTGSPVSSRKTFSMTRKVIVRPFDSLV
jgi:hypothetical protein